MSVIENKKPSAIAEGFSHIIALIPSNTNPIINPQTAPFTESTANLYRHYFQSFQLTFYHLTYQGFLVQVFRFLNGYFQQASQLVL